MAPAAVEALYGKTLPLSASKLDCFAGCRYAFFLQYGLRALPWKQAEFDAPLFGSFVHDVLEHVVREAQAQGGFAALTDAQVAALTERCMDACMQTYLPQGDARASREGYLSTRNRQEAAAVVLDVARELRLSQFTPAAEELTFAPGGQMPPIVYHASRGDGLLTGKIDRVDTYEKDGTTYFRIVDYKTGRKDFSYTDLLYGKDLQMLLYLFALQENQKKSGHPMQPAGALYVPGRCDMIRLEPGEDAGEADAERRKQLRCIFPSHIGLLLDFVFLRFLQLFLEQLEGFIRRFPANFLAGSRAEVKALGDCLLGRRKSDEYRADGISPLVAVGSGDARDADGAVRRRRLARTLGHCAGDGRGHRAVLFQHVRRNAEYAVLDNIRIAHDAAHEHARRARHIRDALGNEAAGAALGGGEGHAARLERFIAALFDSFFRHNKTSFQSLMRTNSRFVIARSIRPSISRTASASRTSSRFGFVRG